MRSVRLIAAIIGVAAIPFTTLYAEDKKPGTENCIPLQQIRNIEVLDNKHLLFEMQPGKNYLNTLPRSCGGLRKNKPIMYKTSISQLCSLDIITVLESYGGGYQPGTRCGLGKFSAISDDEIENFKKELKQPKD